MTRAAAIVPIPLTAISSSAVLLIGLEPHPRLTFHHSPTYASWMNLVERWFFELTTKWLRRGTHRSAAELTGLHQRMDPTLEPRP